MAHLKKCLALALAATLLLSIPSTSMARVSHHKTRGHVITLRALGAAAIDKLLFNYPSNSILGRHKISRNLTVDTIKVKTREGTAFATVWIMSTPIRAKGHKAPKSAARS